MQLCTTNIVICNHLHDSFAGNEWDQGKGLAAKLNQSHGEMRRKMG